MPAIDIAAAIREGMDDPEFSREIRFFDGRLKIAVDDAETVAEFADGTLVGIAGAASDADCKVVVRGTAEHWEEMLKRYPRPFFQCLQTTAVKHGLFMSTTNETYAYLPALNRLLQMMREKANRG